MKYKILIVDDEISVTKYLKQELEEICEDYFVICKNSGYGALKIVMQGEIDLVLTDIAMPDMDGYELYSRTIDYDNSLPVIMMTGFGYDPNHAVVKSKKHGLKDVIFKPFDINKLEQKIRNKISEDRA